ncbi:tetratricopeptide repeat protein [Saccharothrix xinjiangensis]|uniref:Tetratricopeptide repeat protein n=1 Tax=Saccharothrix xinjiangensis TaxID=204798 RepID=A0ABV9Y196_9PSEU
MSAETPRQPPRAEDADEREALPESSATSNRVDRAPGGFVVQAGAIGGDVHLTHTAPAVPAHREVPRQLPLPAASLVGRDRHLAWLDARLRLGGIALLTGTAGVGKTALAVRWAHVAAERFPDGQLYTDLHGYGPDRPRSPFEVLAGLLRALGHQRPERLRTLDERAATFRTWTAGARLLLVIDNVHSAEQVAPLLPGDPRCAVLLTSRSALRALPVDYPVATLTLPRLSEPEGTAVLAPASDPADPRVRELVRRCAGLPLALRIAGSRLARRPWIGVTGEPWALRVMDGGDGPRSGLRAVFSWSCAELPDTEAAAFRLFGVHPGPLDVAAVAAALLIPAPSAAGALEALADAHLVEETAPGRFEAHALLRDYAAELAADDRARLLRRLFSYYTAAADRADDALTPGRFRPSLPGPVPPVPDFPDPPSALRWIDRALPSLIALCAVDEPAVDGARWRLAFALRGFFYTTKRLDAWIDTHTAALAAARRAGDALAQAMTHNNLGMALVEAGRLDEAAAHYTTAEQLFADLGDDTGRAHSRLNAASVLRRRGRLHEAAGHQREALAYYRSVPLPRNTGIALRALSRTETQLDHFDEAIAHADEAVAVAVALELHLDAAQAASSLGDAHAAAGNQALAEVAHHLALHYSRLAGSSHEEATALRRLADTALAGGDRPVAISRYRAALELYRRTEAPDAVMVAQRLMALEGGSEPLLPGDDPC